MITWTLFALSQRPSIQTKLRTELQSVTTDAPSMDELNALPYLEAVVRETMRLHPAVEVTTRVATRDDVVPLARPYTDTKGREHGEIV